MELIVQKYGGSSVADPERIRNVAERVVRCRDEGCRIVVVVSAMGDFTDELVGLAEEVSSDSRRRHPRELDMLLTAGERVSIALLAMAIRDAGAEAISFTGSQAAIITDAAHTGARIEEIRTERIMEELDRGRVVIVAGFQGVSREREITTLGRGGSDTTAVALAAALGAARCDIYTDVAGVFTADPRKVPAARVVEMLDYGEMIELACSGAQVMHPRAVEIGARFGVPIRVLSSFRDGEEGGTLITKADAMIERLALTSLASESGFARVVLRGLPADMEPTTEVLMRLAAAGVSVDMVAHADRRDGLRQLQLTVRDSDLDLAREALSPLSSELGIEDFDVEPGLARLTLVGSGMHDRPGVYATAFAALSAAEIEVRALSTSSISITLLVEADREEEALRLLHAAFELGGSPTP